MSVALRVWVTRAEPGASATADRVRALGFEALVAPLLQVRPLDAELDLIGVGGLAFTSANGLRAFAARSDRRDLTVFAVGDATAAVARALGFAEVSSADGDVDDLVRLIARSPPHGLLLHPGGRARAGDLVGALVRSGMRAAHVALYDTPAVEALSEASTAALSAREVGAVLLHSPRAATTLAPLAAPFDLSRLVAVGLSDHCLQPLRGLGFADLVQATDPREDALLDALSLALGNRSARR